MKKLPIPFLFVTSAFFLLTSHFALAGSATWNLNPTDNFWHNAANWTPATVPNSDSDTATFGVSNTTAIRLTKYAPGLYNGIDTVLDNLVFEDGASSYTIRVVPAGTAGIYLDVDGGGVINNSGVVQNIIVAASGDYRRSAWLIFNNNSTAGENMVITNQGGASATGDAQYGALTAIGYSIGSTASAGKATFINEGSTASGTIFGGFTNFYNYSGAEDATFINNPGAVSGAAAGHTLIQTFPPGGNLGTSTFIANAATVPGAEGGWVEMDVGTCAGTKFIANGASLAGCQGGQIYAYGAENDTRLGLSSYTINGGDGANAEGGLIDVFHLPLTFGTIVTANGGTNGGLGGVIQLENTDDAPVPQFEVYGNGTMDLSKMTVRRITIGSLAGDGEVLLDGHSLAVGGNNLSTSFSGVIEESGALVKIGTGQFSLSGANTYDGGTTIASGSLTVNNQSGSGTGSGAVRVNGGTLGGGGIIAGAVTVGAGSGSGATLAPAAGSNKQATLTIQSALTFQSDSTYACTFKAKGKKAQSDEVIANGVTINSGAQIDLQGTVQGRLRPGVTFTAISNTSAGAINGTFANLPDNGTITVSGATFQASYEGDDGNDLTLTVVP